MSSTKQEPWGGNDISYGRLSYPEYAVTPATIGTSVPLNTTLTKIGFTDGHRSFREYFYDGGPSHFHQEIGGPTFIGPLVDLGPLVRINSGWDDWSRNDIGADADRYRDYITAIDVALNNDGGVSYRAHVQGYAWMPAVINGNMAGTMGEAKRMEAIQIWSPSPGPVICYNAHVEGIGWQGEVCDGAMAGTLGRSLRIEAITIRVPSQPTGGVYYSASLEGIGWQPWRRDGEVAGTTGQSRRLEAIRIQRTDPCTPLTLCSSACVDLSSDARNCGACGYFCDYGCSGGVCNPPPQNPECTCRRCPPTTTCDPGPCPTGASCTCPCTG